MSIDPEGLAAIAVIVKAIVTILKRIPWCGSAPHGWFTLLVVFVFSCLGAVLWQDWHGPAVATAEGALKALVLALSAMAGSVLLDNVAPLRPADETKPA